MTKVIPRYFSFSYFFVPYWNNSVAKIIDILQKIKKVVIIFRNYFQFQNFDSYYDIVGYIQITDVDFMTENMLYSQKSIWEIQTDIHILISIDQINFNQLIKIQSIDQINLSIDQSIELLISIEKIIWS